MATSDVLLSDRVTFQLSAYVIGIVGADGESGQIGRGYSALVLDQERFKCMAKLVHDWKEWVK